MHLDYRLSEDWDENSTDLAAADETDLRYYAATGDIILRKDQVDLSARWGWIPLVDFALALREIAEALAGLGGKQNVRVYRIGRDAAIRQARAGNDHQRELCAGRDNCSFHGIQRTGEGFCADG